MKIAIATGPWLPVPAIQGGSVPRMWQGLAEEFAKQGNQVTILARTYSGQPQTENLNGVTYFRHGGFSQSPNIWLDLVKDFAYALTTFAVLPAADVWMINDFWLPVFTMLRPQLGKIIVNANRFPKGQYWLYQNVDYVAAASLAIEKAIVTQSPQFSSKIGVIPNPINTHIFKPSIALKKESNEKTILYVGRLHPEKGVHLLIEAFALLSQKLANIKLRIVGPFLEHQGGGGESYYQLLKESAQGYKIEFLEPIFDTQNLAAIYQQADLFCYPSLAEKGESFGVAPLEAMATGLAPIVSDLDCFKDFIDPGCGYYFNHRDSAATHLSQTLFRALTEWQKTIYMSQKATQKAQEFSYEKVAISYLNQFELLINHSPIKPSQC